MKSSVRTLSNPFARSGHGSYVRRSAMYDPSYISNSRKKNNKPQPSMFSRITQYAKDYMTNRNIRRKVLLPIFEEIINSNPRYKNIKPLQAVVRYYQERKESDICTKHSNSGSYKKCLIKDINDYLDHMTAQLGGTRGRVINKRKTRKSARR